MAIALGPAHLLEGEEQTVAADDFAGIVNDNRLHLLEGFDGTDVFGDLLVGVLADVDFRDTQIGKGHQLDIHAPALPSRKVRAAGILSAAAITMLGSIS